MNYIAKTNKNKYKIKGLTQLEYDLIYAGLMNLRPDNANNYVSRQYHTDCCPLHHHIERLAKNMEAFTTRKGKVDDEADEILFQ